ncbi:hypothetical protein [Cupriavidus sp. UYPR2.512]|uniref:hypothetical protein n=1 Tax=Cupriavidus sp. UYPR2.512 TaxID=1080187 RepID=UPI000477324F|nr:hypothetical protein [Cupriavidus sp. UYPR2.512]UIF90875.1 hypothetical protein KAF44_32320 [Cupriavidus necator]
MKRVYEGDRKEARRQATRKYRESDPERSRAQWREYRERKLLEATGGREKPVLIMFNNGDVRIGELRWERPTHEESHQAFRYWDDPHNDGQDWGWDDIVFWMPIAPGVPT